MKQCSPASSRFLMMPDMPLFILVHWSNLSVFFVMANSMCQIGCAMVSTLVGKDIFQMWLTFQLVVGVKHGISKQLKILKEKKLKSTQKEGNLPVVLCSQTYPMHFRLASLHNVVNQLCKISPSFYLFLLSYLALSSIFLNTE